MQFLFSGWVFTQIWEIIAKLVKIANELIQKLLLVVLSVQETQEFLLSFSLLLEI
jgi:hypothetical protein